MKHARYQPFLLRLPPGIKDRISAIAAKNRRSMTGEILAILDRAIEEAAGENFGRCAPAALVNETAMTSRTSITSGIGVAVDDYQQR